MRGNAGRVRHLGGLSKRNLYKLYKGSALYIYPTNFEEISCITAMETMACGLPMICSAHAALPETLNEKAGAVIPYDQEKGAADKEFQEAFVEACLSLLHDQGKWNAASEEGKAAAKRCDWSGVASEWVQLASSLLSGVGELT